LTQTQGKAQHKKRVRKTSLLNQEGENQKEGNLEKRGSFPKNLLLGKPKKGENFPQKKAQSHKKQP